MVKRILVVALWFLAGWTLGGFLAWTATLPEAAAPLLGLAAAAFATAMGWPAANRSPAHEA